VQCRRIGEILDSMVQRAWAPYNGKNQMNTAVHFKSLYSNLKIKQPLIYTWLKDEDKRQEEWAWEKATGEWNTKRIWQTQHPKIMEGVCGLDGDSRG